MADTENQNIDPAIAEIIAARQKEFNDISSGNLSSASKINSEENLDPEIVKIIKEKQEKHPDLHLNSNEPSASNQTQEPAPTWRQTAITNALGNIINKARSLDKTDAASVTAGAATGAVLPSLTNVYTPTINPENEAEYKANQKILQNKQTPRQDIVNELEAEHFGKKLNLQDAVLNAQAEANESAKNLKNAALEHEYASKLSINDFLPPEMRTTEEPAELLTNKKPSGAVNWVHSEAEGIPNVLANQATNMRKDNPLGGQAIIDRDTQARLKLQSMGLGGYELTNTTGGAQLSLPTDLAQEEKSKVNRQAGSVSAIAKNIVEKQEAAKQALSDAQKAHDANMSALRKVEENIAAHQATNPVSPERRALAKEEKDLLGKMQDWNEKYGGSGSFTKGAAFIGRKLLPRFSPIIAGAIGPEQAIEAKRLYDKGEYGKAAAYGVGALGSVGMATGMPVSSGLGALAQLPSVYFEGEDLFSPPKR